MKWPVAPLSNIVRIVGGGTPAKANSAFWSGEIPWVSPKDMVSRDIWETQDHISENAVAESATQLVPAGSVLIVVRSGILARSVPIAIACVPVTLNQDMKAFLPTTEALDNQFLAYFLESRSTVLLASIVKRGATVHSLDMNKLQQLQVPIPPLMEQQRIVEILDQADALRKKRTEADAKSERILPALFYKLFGGPATNPNGWERVPLGKLSIGGPQYGANAKAINWFESMPRYVRITDIQEDGSLNPCDIKTLELEDWQSYALQEGDLLFARSGATVGKTYLYQPNDGLCAFAGYLIRFKIDQTKIDPWVVFAVTQTPYYEGWVSSKKRIAAQPNINGQEYASLLIPKPREDLQQAFAGEAKQLIKLRDRRSKMRDQLESAFSSLLHSAFSGYLTAKWREDHMKELLAEMEEQTKYLASHGAHNQRENAVQQESLF